MTNQMCQNLSWFRKQNVSNHLTTDSTAHGEGIKTMRPFISSEYRERIARTKKRMEEAGIEVLLVTNPCNMNYLSGYDGWSFYVHQMVVLAHDADEPIWIGRRVDLNGAKATAFIREENIRAYAEEYVHTEGKHAMDFMADVLKEKGWDKRRLGVEMDSYYFTARAYERLQSNLPNANFVDADRLVNWVRIVKSPQEIDYMRQAGKIVQHAMEVGIDAIAPGVRECEVAAKIVAAEIDGVDGIDGDYPAVFPQMPTGEYITTSHIPWTHGTYEHGQETNLELGACRFRYHAALARTVFLGQPPAKLTKLADVTIEGMNAAIDAVKPGVTCHDVHAAWQRTIARAGFEKETRIGYTIGLGYPPNWGEISASFAPGDRTVLKPNMTFHMVFGMWMDDYGFIPSETVRVTESGAETMSNLARQLFVKQ